MAYQIKVSQNRKTHKKTVYVTGLVRDVTLSYTNRLFAPDTTSAYADHKYHLEMLVKKNSPAEKQLVGLLEAGANEGVKQGLLPKNWKTLRDKAIKAEANDERASFGWPLKDGAVEEKKADERDKANGKDFDNSYLKNYWTISAKTGENFAPSFFAPGQTQATPADKAKDSGQFNRGSVVKVSLTVSPYAKGIVPQGGISVHFNVVAATGRADSDVPGGGSANRGVNPFADDGDDVVSDTTSDAGSEDAESGSEDDEPAF